MQKIETAGNQVIQQGVWTSGALINLLLRIPPRCGSLTADVWELEAANSFAECYSLRVEIWRVTVPVLILKIGWKCEPFHCRAPHFISVARQGSWCMSCTMLKHHCAPILENSKHNVHVCNHVICFPISEKVWQHCHPILNSHQQRETEIEQDRGVEGRVGKHKDVVCACVTVLHSTYSTLRSRTPVTGTSVNLEPHCQTSVKRLTAWL